MSRWFKFQRLCQSGRQIYQEEMIFLLLCLLHQVHCLVVSSPETLTSMVEVGQDKSLRTRFLFSNSIYCSCSCLSCIKTKLCTATIHICSPISFVLQYIIHLIPVLSFDLLYRSNLQAAAHICIVSVMECWSPAPNNYLQRRFLCCPLEIVVVMSPMLLLDHKKQH